MNKDGQYITEDRNRFEPREYKVNTDPLMYDLLEKFKSKKQIEKIIIYSSIIVIGYLFVWVLAIIWLLSYKNVEEEFLNLWERNPDFRGVYPYTRDNYELMATDRRYREKIASVNKVKSIIMMVLTIPFIGWIFVFIAFILSFGVVPLVLYSYSKGPKNYLTNKEEFLAMEGSSRRSKNEGFYPPREPVKQRVEPQRHQQIHQVSEPFFCQVCESSRPATTVRMKCSTCNRFVCIDCFSQMVNVGKTNCPMCEGKLYSV